VQHVLGEPEIINDIFEVTGLMSGVTAEDTTENGVYVGTLDRWITSFRAMALAANLFATRT